MILCQTVSHAAPQLLSLKCQIVVLGRTIPGTLVFTSSLLTFTVDDSTEDYSKAAYLVRSDLMIIRLSGTKKI